MRVIAGIKTIPGREESVNETIRSLMEQVDRVEVIQDKPGNNGDADKFIPFFRALKTETEPFIFLSCDDDLIYPPDYRTFMELALATFGGIVTLHGRNFNQVPVRSYYREGIKYHCLHEVVGNHPVDVGGTGVMAFLSTTCATLQELDFPRAYPLMADIHMATYARKNYVPITCLAHPKGYIQAHPSVKDADTIWGKHHTKDALQTKRVNQMLLIKNVR